MALPLPVQFTQQPGGLQGMYNALSSQALANKMDQLKNQFYAPDMQSQIASRNALTNQTNTMTPLNAANKQLENDWYARKAQAEINYRNMGGPGMDVGQRQMLGLQHQLALDNPSWSPQQVNQSASAYISGNDALPDGTKLPPISGMGQTFLDQIAKKGTTAAILTGAINANQADAELKVLNDYAQKGLEPYGNTYMNMSPAQIMDTFKSDDASQKKLGRFIGSQALQYEAAQNRIRLAKGQPSVSATEDLMKLSGQMVNTHYPNMSYAARKEAARYLDEALEYGLKARQSVGIGAASAKGNKRNTPSAEDFSQMSDDELRKIVGGG